jgi:hypothetical protein
MKAMIRMTLYSLAPAALLAAMTFTAPQPALADEPLIIPRGLACPDFNVGLATTSGPVVEKQFHDKDGNLVRFLSVGKDVIVTWTNFGPDPDNPVAGASVAIKTSGSVMSTRFNSDGTQTVTATGHNALVLFPSDVPAGPTTTQYIGRIVYTVDGAGTFTLLSTSGMERDICAELAS